MASSLQIASVLGLLSVLFTSSLAALTPLSPCPNNFFYDALYDLGAGTVCNSNHVTVQEALLGEGCSTRGTLKISLASASQDPGRRAVLIDLFFNNSRGFSFNLGDSRTNNGYDGDAGTTQYDTEIHTVSNNGFRIYPGDKVAAAQQTPTTVLNAFSTRLTLIVRDGKVQWVSDTAFNYLEGSGIFGLNGQTDDVEARGVANYDLYLGLNKVVYGWSRMGSGLCKAAIRFLCDNEVRQVTSRRSDRRQPRRERFFPRGIPSSRSLV